MLSFKQFLKEETTVFPDFVIKIYSKYSIDWEHRRKIEKIFDEYQSCTYMDIEGSSEITSIFEFNSTYQYEEDTLDDLYFEVEEKINKILFQINEDNEIVHNERYISFQSELPTFKISYQTIELALDPNKELSGIHKMIECQMLTLDNLNNLKPVRGILDLLKIKAKHIAINNFGSLKPWVSILAKYLRGDRDFFKCKSELIEAGLEEYAKL